MKIHFFLLVLLITSCNGTQTVKAKIFERVQVNNNHLLVKFRYHFQGREYTDSTMIENKVIVGDSVDIFIDPSTPNKAILK